MSGNACPGCSVPLHNRVGDFALDHFLAAGFSVDLLTFFAAAAIAGYSFWQQRPTRLGGNGGHQLYHLRTALVLFVVSLFFQWLFLAIPSAMSVTRGYLIFELVPSFFQFVTETILVYSLTRTAYQPLVQARGSRKARGVALGLAIFYGLVTLANWISDAVVLGAEVNLVSNTGFTSGIELTTVVAAVLQLMYLCMSVVWGLVFMGIAIHALRKSRHVLESQFKAVPRLAIGASVLWIIRSLAMIVVDLFFGAADAYGEGAFVYAELAPLISAIVVNVLLLIIFGLVLLAFRPHLTSMYVDGALAEPLGQSYPAKANRSHSTEPGMEVVPQNGSFV